ncbi:MAG: hypothetical protein ABW039_10035 [Sphingobium sp.]
MRPSLPLLILALLPLVACGQEEGANPVSNVLDEGLPNTQQPAPGNAAPGGVVMEETTPPAPAALAHPGAIPVALRGRWAGLGEDCSDRGAELALTVTDRRLVFHESVGEATSVTPHAGGGATVQAAFTGEGESWTRRLSLRPSPDGARLTVLNDGIDTVRKRCAA